MYLYFYLYPIRSLSHLRLATSLARLVHQPLVVREDLPGGDVQAELQRHQNGELGGEQVLAVQPENALGLLQEISFEFARESIEWGKKILGAAAAQHCRNWRILCS